MFTSVKTLALTLGLTILAAAPAMAAMSKNGIWENGVWQNGIWSNGLWQNGVSMNGRQADAHAIRVIGIELPSEPGVR
jgi:hypothetical protein